MTDDATPQVGMDLMRDLCPRHTLPFRQEWPRGVGVMMVKVFEAFVADPRTAEMCPHDAEGKADANALQAVLLEVGPVCCWLGDDKMGELYDQVEQIVLGLTLTRPE